MTRIAVINKKKCNSASCQSWCIKKCPINRTGESCIQLGSDQRAIIEESLCTGCGICMKCIFEAISIINLPEKLPNPIHRFGKNTFELFSLPIPKKGIVTGIIGRNGIGKSTALQILTNSIKPNFGDYTKELKPEEIIQRFSKTPLAQYFKDLYENKIKVSHKPQRIELLPQIYKGKVKDLLTSIDEKGISEDLLKEFGLESIKERDLTDLSGGELQRLAIIAAASKKADFYFFDEPASFCDVTSRIKIAKLIRSLSENAAVIVVEHDLATLDYISDEIQVIYGKPSCYGIFSQPKSVRRGINEYLDGYLPDDNVRFRDYAIRFQEAPEQISSSEILFEFEELEKSYPNFKLKTSSGNIHKGEIMCIMGANGLGKTTFLRLIAGLEKSDRGNIETKAISFKEQYLKQIEGKVIDALIKVNAPLENGWYKTIILNKLGLSTLLNHEISNLSGGELQKLHIALTLTKEADIYAFDEPSAFIDVEDRLVVAEVIKEVIEKKGKCAIVVDHDVQFIDYLAGSMLVFEGKPSVYGQVYGPTSKREGMNRVLKLLDLTYRKDKQTLRPRINKAGSLLDRKQREQGEYYYSS